MGWQVVFLIKPLKNVLTDFGFNLLILGGVFYTIGAVLYFFYFQSLNGCLQILEL